MDKGYENGLKNNKRRIFVSIRLNKFLNFNT